MIHQYKNNGYNIVMDVNSGSVHIVDDVVYDVIPLAEQLVSGGIRDVDTGGSGSLSEADLQPRRGA